jgi:hypothetical protein
MADRFWAAVYVLGEFRSARRHLARMPPAWWSMALVIALLAGAAVADDRLLTTTMPALLREMTVEVKR